MMVWPEGGWSEDGAVKRSWSLWEYWQGTSIDGSGLYKLQCRGYQRPCMSSLRGATMPWRKRNLISKEWWRKFEAMYSYKMVKPKSIGGESGVWIGAQAVIQGGPLLLWKLMLKTRSWWSHLKKTYARIDSVIRLSSSLGSAPILWVLVFERWYYIDISDYLGDCVIHWCILIFMELLGMMLS